MAAINPNTLFKTNALGLRPAANKAAGIASQNAMLTNQSKIAKMQQDSAKHTSDQAQATVELKKSNMDNEFSRITNVAITLGKSIDDNDFHKRAKRMFETNRLTQSEYNDTIAQSFTPEFAEKLLKQGQKLSEIETAKQNKFDNAEKRKTRVENKDNKIIDQNLELDKQEEAHRHNLVSEATADYKAKHPTPLVSIANQGQSEERKAWSKSLVADFGEISKRADQARTRITSLEVLKNIEAPTGKLAPLKSTISGYLAAFGLDPRTFNLDPASGPETYIAVSKRLILEAMQEQAGPQTESDMRIIAQTVASIDKTDTANHFLLDFGIAMADRNVERDAFYRKHRRDSPDKSLEGAHEAWSDHVNRSPMVGKNKNNGKVVFYTQFQKGFKKANPSASKKDIDATWAQNYGLGAQ